MKNALRLHEAMTYIKTFASCPMQLERSRIQNIDNLYYIKNTVVKIISKYSNIRKFLGEMCILGDRGNLSQRCEHRNIIKMKITPKIISPALF